MTIRLVERFGQYIGREEGLALANDIASKLRAKQCCTVDFDGVEVSLPSFFNALLGRLAEGMDVDALESRLSPIHETELQHRSWVSSLRSARTTDADADRMWTAERQALLG